MKRSLSLINVGTKTFDRQLPPQTLIFLLDTTRHANYLAIIH